MIISPAFLDEYCDEAKHSAEETDANSDRESCAAGKDDVIDGSRATEPVNRPIIIDLVEFRFGHLYAECFDFPRCLRRHHV
jgi:hypothetical protein